MPLLSLAQNLFSTHQSFPENSSQPGRNAIAKGSEKGVNVRLAMRPKEALGKQQENLFS